MTADWPSRHLANSQWTADQVRQAFPRAHVDVLYPPVVSPSPSRDRASVRAHFNTPPESLVFVLAARWERGKGQDVLVEALARLPADLPWEAWIAGSATGRREARFQHEVRARIAALELTHRVRVLGSRHDVPDLLDAADIYVQPNTAPEAFGLSLVEAMRSGLPVVTSDIGAAREVVASGGILLPPGDPSALAGALAGLADPVQRTSVGEHGRDHARRFGDPEQTARQLDALLP